MPSQVGVEKAEEWGGERGEVTQSGWRCAKTFRKVPRPGEEDCVCETLTPAGSTVGLGICGLRVASFVTCPGQRLWVLRLLSCFSVGRGWARGGGVLVAKFLTGPRGGEGGPGLA